MSWFVVRSDSPECDTRPSGRVRLVLVDQRLTTAEAVAVAVVNRSSSAILPSSTRFCSRVGPCAGGSISPAQEDQEFSVSLESRSRRTP
jgi:hypothetical protein